MTTPAPTAPAILARLEIDRTRCAGHGLCAVLAPDLIDLDEWGFPALRRAGAPQGDLRRLAAACPALALRVER